MNIFLPKPIDIRVLVEKCSILDEKIDKLKEYKTQYNLTQQYKNAIENSAIVSKTDINGVITYVNDAFCAISGYSKEELIGKTHAILNHGTLSHEVFEDLWKTIKAKLIWKYESLPNKAKDGSTYYVNLTISPILDSYGNITEFISMGFDTSSLQESLIAARKAKETQSTFLANMSHEIRTPLNGIMGFIDLLKDFEQLPKNVLREYIEIISNSSANLLDIINGILDISKIETGNLEIEYMWFNLHDELKMLQELYGDR